MLVLDLYQLVWLHEQLSFLEVWTSLHDVNEAERQCELPSGLLPPDVLTGMMIAPFLHIEAIILVPALQA